MGLDLEAIVMELAFMAFMLGFVSKRLAYSYNVAQTFDWNLEVYPAEDTRSKLCSLLQTCMDNKRCRPYRLHVGRLIGM